MACMVLTILTAILWQIWYLCHVAFCSKADRSSFKGENFKTRDLKLNMVSAKKRVQNESTRAWRSLRKVFRCIVCPKTPAGNHMFNHGWWQLVVGGWRLMAIGGWQLVAGGGWWRLVAVGGGWWLAIGGWWELAVGGWWQWAAVGGWRLVAVGGRRLVVPGGGSLQKKKKGLLKDRPVLERLGSLCTE